MTPSKSQVENLYYDAESVFVISKMLLSNFKQDAFADEEGIYEGVIKGICNLSNQLQMDLFALKEAMKDE